MHERYSSRMSAERVVPRWPELDEHQRDANLDSAAFAPTILASLGLAVGSLDDPRARTVLTDEEVEAGGRLEHLRWVRFTREHGRVDHPGLVPWVELDEEISELDRMRVRDLPELLRPLGLAVVDAAPDHCERQADGAIRHRLLAIDGGGVRGVVALEVLAGLESTLRELTGDPDLLLGTWFDYIAGTSTGAIIATGLALGRSVGELRELYVDHAAQIFRPSGWRRRVRHRYDHAALTRLLQREFGRDRTLGSEDLRCLLMIGLRNASTDSPWPVSSNPAARFNDPALPDSNLQVPLWQLVRASTAAPTYFSSENVTFADGNTHVFSDGGTTTLNNPALQLALMATLPAYRLEWPTGPDRLLLVSVGTGTVVGPARVAAGDRLLWQHAREVPSALITSASVQQDLLCRTLGEVRHGLPLDAEVGDLAAAGLPMAPLFSYARYDAPISARELRRRQLDLDPVALARLDAVDAIAELQVLGRSIAGDVRPEHLDGF